MKKIIWLIPLLLLLGCASTQRVADLEDKIAQLTKQKATGTMLLAEQAGARKFWWRNALIGGGDALDGIVDGSLVNGDAAFVMVQDGTTMTGYLYIYNKDPNDATAESVPIVIAPNAGGGRWYLVNFNAAGLTSNAVDGTHYFQAVNTVAFSGTPTEGMCYWKDTVANENELCCYDLDSATWLCKSWD